MGTGGSDAVSKALEKVKKTTTNPVGATGDVPSDLQDSLRAIGLGAPELPEFESPELEGQQALIDEQRRILAEEREQARLKIEEEQLRLTKSFRRRRRQRRRAALGLSSLG